MGSAIVFTLVTIAVCLISSLAFSKGFIYKAGTLGTSIVLLVYSLIIALILCNLFGQIIAKSLYNNYVMVEYKDVLVYSILFLLNASMSILNILTSIVLKIINKLTLALGVSTAKKYKVSGYIMLFLLGVLPEAIIGYMYLLNGGESLASGYAALLVWCFLLTMIALESNAANIFKIVTGNLR